MRDEPIHLHATIVVEETDAGDVKVRRIAEALTRGTVHGAHAEFEACRAALAKASAAFKVSDEASHLYGYACLVRDEARAALLDKLGALANEERS